MCFSAEASFTAAAILGTIGCITLSKCSNRSFIPIALVPLLFSIQQFSEGFLWLHLKNNSAPDIASNLAQSIYLMFAFLIWPVWIAFSLAIAEKVKWRSQLLYLLLGCGIILSLINLYYGLGQTVDIHIHIVNHSLQYFGDVPKQMITYPLIIILPTFISSLKKVWVFGILIISSYIVAIYLYDETFVSVWCFFAAFVSLLTYFVVKDN